MFRLIKVLFVLVLIPLNSYSKSCELFETIETPSDNISKSFTKSDQAFIFFDNSLNMEGFVEKNSDNSSKINYNYIELINKLPLSLPAVSKKQSFQKFSNNIKPIGTNEVANAIQKSFYQCHAGVTPLECTKKKSKISKVFNIIAKQNSENSNLFIIVTDLALKEEELIDKGLQEIEAPLKKTLDSGKSIGVFGIKSKFNGKIWGLPSGGNYDRALERPFFMIMVGDQEVILKLKKILESELFNEVQDENYYFSLFTNDLIANPITPSNFSNKNFLAANGIKQINFLEESHNSISQFSFEKKHDPLSISFDLANIQTNFTPNLDKFIIRTKIKNLDKCRDFNFKDEVSQEKFIIFNENADSKINFNFLNRANKDSNLLPRGRNYAIQASIYAQGTSNESLNWFQDWSYSRTEVDEIISKGVDFFPVFNLSNFGNLLIRVQEERFTEQLLGNFQFAVSLQ